MENIAEYQDKNIKEKDPHKTKDSRLCPSKSILYDASDLCNKNSKKTQA